MQRGTFQWMKSVNKSIILNKIRTGEPISRAQIAKETKLTPPTVSSIVKELIDQGLVRESNLGKSRGGRKPTMLHIHNQSFYIIGVDAGPETVDSILADLSGNIMERASESLDKPLTNAQFVVQLKKCIWTIIQSSAVNIEKMIGIGVAMHGVVDVETGTSLVAPNLSLENIPIKSELEKEFGLEVIVENDARAMALGENWFGNHGEPSSMLAINLGRGVGAGLVINGKLYHGAKDIAGEIGHMTIDMNGAICDCGNRGCLQTFVTGPAIAARAERMLGQSSDDEMTGEKVYQLARTGEKQYVEVLQETGRIIGVGLTNLIHIINPELIVLGGGVMNAAAFMMPLIQQTIEQRALTPQAKQTQVAVSELGENATLLGAVALLLVELFNPELDESERFDHEPL